MLRKSHGGKGGADASAVVVADPAEHSPPAPQTQSRQGFQCDGKPGRKAAVLRQVSDVTGSKSASLNAAGKGPQRAGQALEQGRLARPVRADNGAHLARCKGAGKVVHGRAPLLAQRQVFEGDCDHPSAHRVTAQMIPTAIPAAASRPARPR